MITIMKNLIMLTLTIFLVGTTVFAQSNASNSSGTFARAIRVNTNSAVHYEAYSVVVNEIEIESKNAKKVTNIGLQSYHSNKNNRKFYDYNTSQSFDGFVFSQRFTNIDWLSYSAPISQNKISLNIGKVTALPYCTNCNNHSTSYKAGTGGFGVTFNLIKQKNQGIRLPVKN